MDERRRHVRVKCRCATEVRPRLPTHDVLLSVTVELSVGGCFVRSNRPPPIGTPIEVDLRLNQDQPLHVQGVVLYEGRASDSSGEPGERGFAVGFTVLDGDTASQLERYLAGASHGTPPAHKNGNGHANGQKNGGATKKNGAAPKKRARTRRTH